MKKKRRKTADQFENSSWGLPLGFSIGLIAVVVWIVGYFMEDPHFYQGAAVVIFFFAVVLAVIAGIAKAIYQMQHITHLDSYRYGDGTMLLRILEGQVVEHGRRVWLKPGDVYQVRVPWCHTQERFSTQFNLQHQVGDVVVTVRINLVAFLKDTSGEGTGLRRGFNLQEIYRVVVKKEHGGVEDWLLAQFKAAVHTTPAVQTAIETYALSPALQLVEAVQLALKQVEFDFSALSNIGRVVATVVVDSVSYRAQTEFNR